MSRAFGIGSNAGMVYGRFCSAARSPRCGRAQGQVTNHRRTAQASPRLTDVRLGRAAPAIGTLRQAMARSEWCFGCWWQYRSRCTRRATCMGASKTCPRCRQLPQLGRGLPHPERTWLGLRASQEVDPRNSGYEGVGAQSPRPCSAARHRPLTRPSFAMSANSPPRASSK